MDMRLYAEDAEGGLRSANRAGGNAPVIARARIAVINKAANAKALLDAGAGGTRTATSDTFQRAQFLRRADKAAEAGELILSVPADPSQAIDSDQWWIERRWSPASFSTSTRSRPPIASRATPRSRARQLPRRASIHRRWIALRFLNDPATALAHFAKVGQGNSNPITLARAGYWQGRAAEAMGEETKRARTTRRRHATPRRITARSRVRDSATRTSCCARRRKPRRIAPGSRSRVRSNCSTPSTNAI